MSDSLNPNTQPELSDQDAELLSAYIDGMLSDSEQQALDARLADDAFLRSELYAMRQTVALIHALPTLKAPRNFTITADDVNEKNRASRMITFPKVNWWAIGSAAAMILLVIGIVPVLLSSNQGFGGASPAADSAEIAQDATRISPQETSARFMASTATAQPTQTALQVTPFTETNDARTTNAQGVDGSGAQAVAMPSTTPELLQAEVVEEAEAADDGASDSTIETDTVTSDQADGDIAFSGEPPASPEQANIGLDESAETEAEDDADLSVRTLGDAAAPEAQLFAIENNLILQFLDAMRRTVQELGS